MTEAVTRRNPSSRQRRKVSRSLGLLVATALLPTACSWFDGDETSAAPPTFVWTMQGSPCVVWEEDGSCAKTAREATSDARNAYDLLSLAHEGGAGTIDAFRDRLSRVEEHLDWSAEDWRSRTYEDVAVDPFDARWRPSTIPTDDWAAARLALRALRALL